MKNEVNRSESPRSIIVVTILLITIGLHPAAGLEPVRVSEDGKGFALATSGRPFRIWGLNYDHDRDGRLLEDYWKDEWKTVEEDFGEMRDLGANVVRVHLQLGRFMKGPDEPDSDSLSQLKRLLELADRSGLYLDVTGLGCYHKQDVPAWYDSMDESARWEVQSAFWAAVAGACRDSPAVFCYDLMNEPIIGGDVSEGWLAGELGGKYFVQRLTLDARGRSSKEIAGAWLKTLTASIRSQDPERLITVGAIPWSMVWPNAKPVFYGTDTAGKLDFVSVHVYPKTGEVDKALEALEVYDVGTPLVIEEMFPLNCSPAEMNEFVRKSDGIADGWISFYWGKTIAEYEAAGGAQPVDVLMADWLGRFRDEASRWRRP